MTAENVLTHWSRVTHLCVGNLTIIGSDNGLSPGRRQAIIRTNAGILLIRPLGTNFSEFLVEILIFSFKKMRLKVSSAKRRSFCLGLNELTHWSLMTHTGLKQLGHHWYRQCFVAYLTHLANKLPILNRNYRNLLYPFVITHSDPGPCITNVFATCRKNFSQWHSSFLAKNFNVSNTGPCTIMGHVIWRMLLGP